MLVLLFSIALCAVMGAGAYRLHSEISALKSRRRTAQQKLGKLQTAESQVAEVLTAAGITAWEVDPIAHEVEPNLFTPTVADGTEGPPPAPVLAL